jgi:rRNA maturation endonuclease Nob1
VTSTSYLLLVGLVILVGGGAAFVVGLAQLTVAYQNCATSTSTLQTCLSGLVYFIEGSFLIQIATPLLISGAIVTGCSVIAEKIESRNTVETTAEQEAPVKTRRRICPSCGIEVDPNAKFCPDCGADLTKKRSP